MRRIQSKWLFLLEPWKTNLSSAMECRAISSARSAGYLVEITSGPAAEN